MSLNAPEVALIGGGTGSFTLLQELKEFTPNITSIVNMCDDGASTGVLRDELGVLPPGDLRQCLVALSDLPEVRELFSYRFGKGRLSGQSIGNIILSGLELQHDGDIKKAINVASNLLQIKRGKVVPVSLENHVLIMQDGEEVVHGESAIGRRKIKSTDAKLWLEPNVPINPDAEEAIKNADLVVIAPGNLYGSILPTLMVSGVRAAVQDTKAKTIAVSNLVTKPGQTDGWHVVDYVKKLETLVGAGSIDYVLFNEGRIDPELLDKYAHDGEYPVSATQDRFREITATPIGDKLVSKEIYQPDANDTLIKRTLIRHDAKQVGRQLMRLFFES
jgi:uncharacterized cofD-like protein